MNEEIAGHTFGCSDRAAFRAWDDGEVESYPSREATARGAQLIDSDIINCACEDFE